MPPRTLVASRIRIHVLLLRLRFGGAGAEGDDDGDNPRNKQRALIPDAIEDRTSGGSR